MMNLKSYIRHRKRSAELRVTKRAAVLFAVVFLWIFAGGIFCSAEASPVTPASVDLKDGEYSVSLDMEGGSGKAFITSPTLMTVKDGQAYVRLEWSSSNYDYMIVGTEKYLNTSEENVNSAFEIPIACWDQAMPVIADTTAMGTPHEVEYTLIFYKDSIGSKGQLPQEAAKRVVIVAMIIIVGGGILDHYVKKKRR